MNSSTAIFNDNIKYRSFSLWRLQIPTIDRLLLYTYRHHRVNNNQTNNYQSNCPCVLQSVDLNYNITLGHLSFLILSINNNIQLIEYASWSN